MSSLLSKDSISLSGLSLTMSGSIKHKDKTPSRPSSFYAVKEEDEPLPSPNPSGEATQMGAVPAPKKDNAPVLETSRDTSRDREQGSDGSWSVVSGDGRSRAGSVGDQTAGIGTGAAATPTPSTLVLGPVV
jgi:hypothetical protein